MTRFQQNVQEGQFISLTLPAQEPMNEAGEPASPPAKIVIFHQHEDRRALVNALALLETLYAHNVASPHVLKLVLLATGHTQNAPGSYTDLLQANNAGSKPADQTE